MRSALKSSHTIQEIDSGRPHEVMVDERNGSAQTQTTVSTKYRDMCPARWNVIVQVCEKQLVETLQKGGGHFARAPTTVQLGSSVSLFTWQRHVDDAIKAETACVVQHICTTTRDDQRGFTQRHEERLTNRQSNTVREEWPNRCTNTRQAIGGTRNTAILAFFSSSDL